MIALFIAALLLLSLSLGALFWQMKRASSAMDKLLALSGENAGQRILLAAAEVSVADKERAMNILISERDNLKKAYDSVREQRNALLEESLENANPGVVASSVRDAIEQLRDLRQKEKPEDLPDVPST